MASPLGHAMVGIAAAAVVARVTGAPRSLELWAGSFIASGLPDLDVVLSMLGLRGPRFHRNASHSLVVLGAVLLGGWVALQFIPFQPDLRIALAWSVALITHPLLDVVTSGPSMGERGYGIGLFWPVHPKRWFLQRPIIDQSTDWGACGTVRDVWEGVRPEIYRLAPVCVLVTLLTLLV